MSNTNQWFFVFCKTNDSDFCSSRERLTLCLDSENVPNSTVHVFTVQTMSPLVRVRVHWRRWQHNIAAPHKHVCELSSVVCIRVSTYSDLPFRLQHKTHMTSTHEWRYRNTTQTAIHIDTYIGMHARSPQSIPNTYILTLLPDVLRSRKIYGSLLNPVTFFISRHFASVERVTAYTHKCAVLFYSKIISLSGSIFFSFLNAVSCRIPSLLFIQMQKRSARLIHSEFINLAF